MEKIVSYVLSGGVGARLAPCSTPELPKQYLRLFGGETLLGTTIERIAAGGAPVNLVASQHDHAHLEPYRNAIARRGGAVLLEPIRRNTAIAVAVATAHARERGVGELVLITPCDHQIEDATAFWETVDAGAAAAREGRLVLFGIRPTRPETGFGYIEIAGRDADARVMDVSRFREKPDLRTATRYVSSGRHFWNSGVFLFRSDVLRDWFLHWEPRIWHAAELALAGASRPVGWIELAAAPYEDIRSNPFDRAIVERAKMVSVVRAGFRWRDLGTWRSLVEATVAPWPAVQ